MNARLINLFIIFAFVSLTYPTKSIAQNLSFPGQNMGQAQAPNPVKWSFDSKKINETERELIFTAKIDKGWHIYSTVPSKDDLGIPTTFNLDKSASFKAIGKVTEPVAKREYDESVGEYYYHKGTVVFKQKIKALTTEEFTIKGYVEFMACLHEQCLPPDEAEFSIKVAGSDLQVVQNTSDLDTIDKENDSTEALNPVVNTNIPEPQVIEDFQNETSESKTFWGIFIAGFFGGFLALLTPCVFPMIPLTVSFFTKKSKNRLQGIGNALIYGLSIIVLYVGLGFIITKTLGADGLNELQSEWWMNALFFIVFIVFAMSFLGAFEITLPNSWINKADAASDKGGLIGIFFMAFTLSLVSFSCTGPIIGTLLVEAAVNGSNTGPILGMAGFSLALALPFGLFAAFPGWLNSLPKSGGWLNSVKVVLGLLELALAMKFLSNIDLAYRWDIITREVFLALWIIIFSILGFYLLGKIKFSHDSDVKHVSIPRLFLAIITFAFVVYLIPGMWGAPLKMISGFPPPQSQSEGWSMGQSNIIQTSNSAGEEVIVDGIDRSHCPHNLPCFHDYDKALQYARSQNKPLFVDFTGHTCVNCRKMEERVWADPRILQRLTNDYVVVSLYVDEKGLLPIEEQYISPVTGKKIKSIGNKWSDFQITRFKSSTQPVYALLDENEQMLTASRSYDTDIEEYIKFLDKGKAEFAKRNAYMPTLQVDLK
jgi:thiol:disulfide interchange protein